MVKFPLQNYLGLYDCSDSGIKTVDGRLRGKFGVTEQRPRKRQAGGDYSGHQFDIRLVVTVDKNSELELKEYFNTLSFLEFETDEIFNFPVDKWIDIQKAFINITNKYLSNFKND